VNQLQVDRDALANHSLRVLELSLRFQDGEFYDAPGADDLPDAVDLSQLPQSQQTVTYYAALPAFKPFGGNFGDAANSSGSSAVRYLQHNQDTPDLYTQAAPAQLSYLKKRAAGGGIRATRFVHPLPAAAPAPRGHRRLRAGRLVRAAQPVLRAAPLLFLQLRRLLDALQAKVSALYGHHREPSKHVIEFRSGDMSSFWLLHTASTAFASLTHYFQHPALHPERLYEQLLAWPAR
jgi:type VI secretion system protein ImpJ